MTANRDGEPRDSESKPKKNKTKSRRRRRAGRSRPPKRLADRTRLIEQELASAAREAYGEMFGYRDESARPFTVELKVRVEPGERWRLTDDSEVEAQIRQAVQSMAASAGAYRRGRVYCYRCETSECVHTQPPRPMSVFSGYASNGLPSWPDLPQYLLDLGHPEVDRLFEPGQRALLAAYVDGEALRDRQLRVFGRESKTYRIMGQVVFGFLRLRQVADDPQTTQRVAITLQAVEHRRIDGSPAIELNVLGRLENGAPALDAIEGPYQMRILDQIVELRRKIVNLSPAPQRNNDGRPNRIRSDAPFVVNDLFKDLVRRLQSIGRQRRRRTVHAEERREENRPTSKATEDAVSAPDDHLLWDDRNDTVVVIGPRKRVHVFSLEGRHVTTLLLEPDAIRNRLKRKRWQLLSDDRLSNFNVAIGRVSERVRKTTHPARFQR